MGLTLPADIERLALEKTDHRSAHLPPGFVPFSDYALGNGDVFGLYWPIGREGKEPLIAETYHDEGSLMPAFSSLRTFLAMTADLDEADHPEFPVFEEDPHAPLGCYQEARKALRDQNVETAIKLLDRAISTLPEYTNALALLTAQYVRLDRQNDACRTAVHTVISPPSFGAGQHVARIWSWLAQQEAGPASLSRDPIWIDRVHLASVPSGGSRENDSCRVLASAIDTYVDEGEFVSALTLMQAYAEFMNAETVSFQERYGFDYPVHRAKQRQLSKHLPDGPRFFD